MEARPHIAIVGRFLSDNPALHFARGLRESGFTVTEIEDNADSVNLGEHFIAKATRRLFRPLNRIAFANSILRRHDALNFDILLVLKGQGITKDSLAKLRSRNIKMVNWYPDFDFGYAGFDENLFRYYDIIATSKRHQLGYLRAHYPESSVELVEHGFCPGIHRPIAPAKLVHDVSYVGNATRYKADMLREIALRAPNRTFAVAGNRWSQYKLPANVTLHGERVGDMMSEFLSQSRCALAFHMGPAGEHGWADSVSARSFEIPACKVAMIHIANEEISCLYNENREFLSFNSPDEAAQKIDSLLEDERLRLEIALAGHNRAIFSYSYVDRGRQLAKLIRKQLV